MAAFTGAHAILQHSNIDLKTGPLDVILATARVHRWHHSPKREEADANYGPTLTLWDWVFGTRRFAPERVPPEDVGLGDGAEKFPTSFVGQLRAPFDGKLWGRASS
jgi:sterol desaturase/sphingolipid hydroxylase (fatty acid hydroxylase superfamily)